MKKALLYILSLLIITSFSSCEKEPTAQERKLKGTWTYSKAEKVKLWKKNTNILDEYEHISIIIDEYDRFKWTENNKTCEGTITFNSEVNTTSFDEDIDITTNDSELYFEFDNGDEVIFHHFSQRKKHTEMLYNSHDNSKTFILKKSITSSPRR